LVRKSAGVRPYDLACFTVSPIPGLYFLVVLAIFGMAIDAITRWLGSLIMKSGTGGVIKDSFPGSFGYLVGFFGSIFMPWPENTISKRLAGGGTMSSTINTYQHPRAGGRRCGYCLAGAARMVSLETKTYRY
jgi:hypothetical protein